MAFINPLVSYPQPQIREALLSHYKGRSVDDIPTPSLLIKESVINGNTTRALKRLERTNYKFRAHVKTHKTIEIARKQLGYDLPEYDGKKYDSIVVSTLQEAFSILNHQTQTGDVFVNDIVYGLPNITPDTLVKVVELQKQVKNFRLLVDNIEHLKILKKFSREHEIKTPWSLFVKLDAGTARAGISDDYVLGQVLSEIISSEELSLFGLYVHAGHSYDSRTVEESEAHFFEELETIVKGLNVLKNKVPDYDLETVVGSVGATPTLHSLEHDLFTETSKKVEELVKATEAQIEVHAGNYSICDLQQASTGCINIDNIAVSVLGSVISQYPRRKHPVGELLTNTGVISLSREVSPNFPGFGKVIVDIKYGEWAVNRVSQEHGILQPSNGSDAKLIPIGTKIKIVPNHACITANSYNAYYVIDDDDKVVDIYIPWRGW
ncbi:Alanine racemase 1 [Wickerhamomyces ciferrii]|uniref:D-serine dehydratase n=1 Tax=Wickerhamomyces ciferrii (strain ATCC 14091 / BCRC 22168 / CBS 111 / JCM 3599 / NBRC 0793 / NRRL Y-1031 F-60-10) TaxID=1206466 RepID=K0KZM1_WICCF|nr:Alanine racemase 1 [Wickerhamomyces ciferrii]CCH46759.1 Alanine racemase 1 [Wickerhamomyces ciferrii]